MKMKSVAVLCFGLFTVVISDKAPCEIGDSKQDDCNTCECMRFQDHSVDWYCTNWQCTNPHQRHQRVGRSTPTDQCQIGATKSEKSQICTCMSIDEGGTEWVCDDAPNQTQKVCTKGDTLTEVCRSCKCINTDDGGTKWFCIHKACLYKDANQHQKRGKLACKVGTITKKQCYLCRCVSSITGVNMWDCVNQCGEIARSKRGTAVATDLINTPCALNDSFKLGCNTCYCKSDKTGYLCTDYACPPEGSNSSLPVNSTTETVPESITTLFENTTDQNVSSSTQN